MRERTTRRGRGLVQAFPCPCSTAKSCLATPSTLDSAANPSSSRSGSSTDEASENTSTRRSGRTEQPSLPSEPCSSHQRARRAHLSESRCRVSRRQSRELVLAGSPQPTHAHRASAPRRRPRGSRTDSHTHPINSAHHELARPGSPTPPLSPAQSPILGRVLRPVQLARAQPDCFDRLSSFPHGRTAGRSGRGEWRDDSTRLGRPRHAHPV